MASLRGPPLRLWSPRCRGLRRQHVLASPWGESMRDGDSLTKARYALTILRVAQGADQQTAARLVWGLVRDLTHANERPGIARIHLAAVGSAFRGAGWIAATNSYIRRRLVAFGYANRMHIFEMVRRLPPGAERVAALEQIRDFQTRLRAILLERVD